jgi:TRAP-type mannitol/chloroaromatic compound transport system substrate-binding protein
MDRRSFVTGLAVGGAVGAGAASLLIKPKEVIKEVEVVKEVAAPAIAKERVEIAMVSTWPRDFPGLGTGAQRFAQKLSDVSDGRIQVTYYAAGERVGAFDSFDEVASGNAQAYHAADYYWKGKHPGWAYFTAVPFGLTYPEMKAWLRWMGGQELHDE